jgi:hypothetical protein
MTAAKIFFQRQTLEDALGQDVLENRDTFFGVDVFDSLLFNKEWIGFMLAPYLNLPKCSPNQIDIFSELTSSELNRLRRNPNTMLMFNYVWEGNSYKVFNFWEMLTCSALRHGIPSEKIFFFSSNLRDEEQYDIWQRANMPDQRINVIAFNFFANWSLNQIEYTIDHAVDSIKKNHKLFLSMNRRLREMRVYTIYKIFESRLFENTMISYDQLTKDSLSTNLDSNVDLDTYERLIDSSPSVLDFPNFSENWACTPISAALPTPLFEKTIISLISETLFDTHNNSSLFFSEKTFKPMLYYHPIMIFGQPELNTYLEKIGFKNYKNYFDLSFDTIEDHVTRINLQVAQLEILNDRLACMTADQRVDWVMQDRETLEYNKEALQAQDFNKKQIQKLIDIVKSMTE